MLTSSTSKWWLGSKAVKVRSETTRKRFKCWCTLKYLICSGKSILKYATGILILSKKLNKMLNRPQWSNSTVRKYTPLQTVKSQDRKSFDHRGKIHLYTWTMVCYCKHCEQSWVVLIHINLFIKSIFNLQLAKNIKMKCFNLSNINCHKKSADRYRVQNKALHFVNCKPFLKLQIKITNFPENCESTFLIIKYFFLSNCFTYFIH